MQAILPPRRRRPSPWPTWRPAGRGAGGRGRARLPREEASRPFDLERGPLLPRLAAAPGAEDHAAPPHRCTTSSATAGRWRLIRELSPLYRPARQRCPSCRVPLRATTPSGSAPGCAGRRSPSELAYWRQRLAGAAAGAGAADGPAAAGDPQLPRRRPCPWPSPPRLSAGLLALARREGATLFMALLAVFAGCCCRAHGAGRPRWWASPVATAAGRRSRG